MKHLVPLALFSIALLSACADFLAKPNASEYVDACKFASHNQRLDDAERECYLAFVNTNWVNSPKLKSERLYDLALAKQQNRHFSEAELLFRESLQIEENLVSTPRVVGLRLVGLSAALAGQNKWSEGAPFLERVMPIVTQFSRSDRLRLTQLFDEYGSHLKQMNQVPRAKRFTNTAFILNLN